MHASDPSIQLVVIILETMLIAFRFSYKIAAKLKALGIFYLHRAHYLGPKVGKSNMCRLLTGYFGSGKPSSVRSRVWNFPNADSVKTIFRRGTKMNSGSYHIWFSHFGLILELFLPADPPQTPPHHRYLVGEAERAPSSSPDVLGQGWISEITTAFLGFGHARSSTKQTFLSDGNLTLSNELWSNSTVYSACSACRSKFGLGKPIRKTSTRSCIRWVWCCLALCTKMFWSGDFQYSTSHDCRSLELIFLTLLNLISVSL